MRFLDAQKRKIIHIESGIGVKNITIHAEDYLVASPQMQLAMLQEQMNERDFKSSYANFIKVELYESEDNILTDDEISSMFSNIMVIYSKYFKKQKFKVLTPKAKLFESMPVTPVSLMTATMLYIVDKPFQIEVNRLFNFGEDQERIRLI